MRRINDVYLNFHMQTIQMKFQQLINPANKMLCNLFSNSPNILFCDILKYVTVDKLTMK